MAYNRNDNIRKLCDCDRRNWAKCKHPWHFNFQHMGKVYRYSLKKLVGRKIEDKSDALREARRLQIAIEEGTFKRPGQPDVVEQPSVETVETYARTWAKGATRLKASTIRFYTDHLENHIYPSVGAVPIAEVKRRDVKRLIAALQAKGLKRNTVAGIVRTLSTVLSEAVEDEILPANPALRPGKHLKDPNAPKKAQIDPYTREEAALLIDTAREHFPEWHPWLLCAFRTGLRLGELRALRWSDIDWRNRFVVVGRNWVEGKFTTPKNGKSRKVDMSLQLRSVLRLWRRQQRIAWLKAGTPQPELVFPSSAGTPHDDSKIRKAMVKILNKAEVRRRPSIVHVLRHTFGSLLLQQGESLVYVKEQMGHSSIQVTADVYGHLVPGGNRAAVDRLDDQENAKQMQSAERRSA